MVGTGTYLIRQGRGQKKNGNIKVVKFDLFWRIVSLIGLECYQMKVCVKAHPLPCQKT